MPAIRSTPPFVYFLRRADGEGPVKIGCSQSPQERLATMMAWSPYPLALLATIPGDEATERRFHAHFTEAWSHGEWFAPAPALLQAIDDIRAGSFDLSTLPLKGKRPRRPDDKRNQPQSEGRRLKSRSQRLFYRSGLREPADVTAAIEAFDEMSAEEQVTARAIILAHLDDPVARGTLCDYEWAVSGYAKWAAKNGAPPLVIAKAA